MFGKLKIIQETNDDVDDVDDDDDDDGSEDLEL